MKYWIIIQDTRKGPLTAEEIAATETIARTTPVWHAGLEGWVTVADVDELLAIVQRREASPTVPPPSPVSISGSETAAGASRPQWHTPWGVPKPAPVPPQPATYLVWNIIATLLCCLPTGIVGIVMSTKVSSLYERGMYSEARRMSERASLWLIVSIVLGLVSMPFQILVGML